MRLYTKGQLFPQLHRGNVSPLRPVPEAPVSGGGQSTVFSLHLRSSPGHLSLIDPRSRVWGCWELGAAPSQVHPVDVHQGLSVLSCAGSRLALNPCCSEPGHLRPNQAGGRVYADQETDSHISSMCPRRVSTWQQEGIMVV